MDEHLRPIPMSMDLLKRTQATILALAKTLELVDTDQDLQAAVQNALGKPPENVRYVTASLLACMEYWIVSGYYTRLDMIDAAASILKSIKPLPEGPTRRGADDHA